MSKDLNARDVLGMDNNGVMAVGIGALQKLINTLKSYKERCEQLEKTNQLLVEKSETQSVNLLEALNKLAQAEERYDRLNKSNQQLQETQLALRCVNSINIDDL